MRLHIGKTSVCYRDGVRVDESRALSFNVRPEPMNNRIET
jgi:hypothetical protein